jgi:uncharacterized protein
MQRRNGDLVFAPTDLVNFLGCSHATVLDVRHAGEPRSARGRAEPDALMIQKGLEHETAHLEALRAAGKNVVGLKGVSSDERAEQTLAAMRGGAEVIYQAALADGLWGGVADFLMRADEPSALGAFGYEPLDTKFARGPKPEYVIQLGIYSELLAAAQRRPPRRMLVVLDGGEEVVFAPNHFDAYVRHAKRRLESFAGDPPAESYPQPCAHCGGCDWRERCQEQWEHDDHLSFVANIRASQREQLEAAGIKTLAALASAPANLKVPDLSAAVFERLRAQAALQLHKRDTQNNKYELLAPEADRGFARLPKPDPGDLFFDMEGDPLYSEGLEYLFGVYYRSGEEFEFQTFWAHDHEQERVTFGKFMAFLREHLATHPGAFIYHYNHYEPSALKRLASNYSVAEHQLDDLLRRRKFVDLYKVVREAMRVSEPSYSLKNLEKFYMEKRAGAVADAADSIEVYNRWRVSGDPALLKDIAAYNEFDCRSTAALRDWLLTLRPPETPWFAGGDPDGEETEANRGERERRYAEYQEKLQAAAGQDEEDYRWHLADLLGFHQREAKPQWWAFFDRRDSGPEELLDDYECLACLERVGEAVPDKQSLIYTYSFPAQETKRREGEDGVIDVATGKGVGRIKELDEVRCRVRLRRGRRSGPLPDRLTIGPPKPIGNEVLRDALYRVADDVLGGGGRYPVIGELLRNAAPRLKGRRPGEPIAQSDDLLTATTEAVVGLDRSFLFVQGPPGTGKTYTGAHVIVELIRRGKRVGIASNSHMAINNLLKKTVELARATGVKFAAVKKSSGDEREFDGDYVEFVTSNKDVSRDAELLAGTAWLFADESFDNHLDYLFIDEAGQVSLANVVAMGTSAKNLVLIGDQMQLGQPIQGVHPGRAGLSVLDFLLADQATVPPERGFFLGRSRRMRPEVCRFISDTFYDGRLDHDPLTEDRRLIFAGDVAGLPPEGVVFRPVEHVGCSQKSVEEGAVVKDYFERLLKQRFRENGKSRPLGVADILVVTPYNVQVNYLRSILPDGAKIGTVDKFQGQEAPVVIVSMVASSAEDVPRGMDFLFSANRLNVAVSRAQCLAVVAASPRLLAAPCATVGQLRLANNFCRLAEYSTRPE